MNASKHAEISVRRRGGVVEDYLEIHNFIDSTKELCSDNRHRILHNLWGIRRIIVPIFGETIINNDGKTVNVKDLCEQDHILPDYQNRFIPTLNDFSDAISDSLDINMVSLFHKFYEKDKEVSELLLSPLALTGKVKSLFLTHNSWFVNEIIPKIFNRSIQIRDFDINPAYFFDSMDFKLWMDNGCGIPPSAKKTNQMIVG